MRKFKISNTFDLLSLNEDIIILKAIKAPSMDDLMELQLVVSIKYDNSNNKSYQIQAFDPNLLDAKVPEAKINHKIVDCKLTTFPIHKPIGTESEDSWSLMYDRNLNSNKTLDQISVVLDNILKVL